MLRDGDDDDTPLTLGLTVGDLDTLTVALEQPLAEDDRLSDTVTLLHALAD